VNTSRPLRILIAGDDPLARQEQNAQLIHLGHQVIAEARDRQEAINLARRLRPDLIVLDFQGQPAIGLETCKQIEQQYRCPFILLSAYSDPELIRRSRVPCIQAYLVKPVTERDLEPAIEVAFSAFSRIQKLEQELSLLRDMLHTRTTLSQAIDHLVTDRELSRTDAFRWIQEEARAKRAGLGDVAQAVINQQPVAYRYDVPI
jgi:AmiR/NasT family two-component response regulator